MQIGHLALNIVDWPVWTLSISGLETYFFSHSQTFASGFILNSQIAVSNSQLVFPTFEQFLTLRCGMAIASWGWNLVHRSPLCWQRTCWRPHSSFLRLKKYIIFPPLPSHGKTASLCYEALRLFHCFYCRLAETSLRPRSGFGIRWNIELATFLECLYFQLAKLNFNSHFASLQAWISSPEFTPLYIVNWLISFYLADWLLCTSQAPGRDPAVDKAVRGGRQGGQGLLGAAGSREGMVFKTSSAIPIPLIKVI